MKKDPFEVSLKEPASESVKTPVMFCHVTIYPVTWDGSAYQGADVFIDHCCKENEASAEALFVQRSDAPACGRSPENFLKVMFQGKPVESCPFCGARIEVVQEARETRERWF